MTTMLPKVLEIERHQLADYARVDYAITKGEDEVAALEELCLGPNELRREASVVRDRTVLAVREVRNNMAKRAIAAKNMQRSLVESLRQQSRFAVVDTVDASLRARCFASLECIPTLTLICHFIDAIKAGDFARAESVRFEFHTREDRHEYAVASRAIFARFAPCEPADILKRIAKSVARLKWRTQESLTCFAAVIQFLCFIGSRRRIVDQIDFALLTLRFLARVQFLRESTQLYRSAHPHLLHDTSLLELRGCRSSRLPDWPKMKNAAYPTVKR